MNIKNVQINFVIVEEKKDILKKIARIRSLELNKDITYLDLIREKVEELIETSGSIECKLLSG